MQYQYDNIPIYTIGSWQKYTHVYVAISLVIYDYISFMTTGGS